VLAHIPLQPYHKGRTGICTVPGCGKAYRSKGLCHKHYMEKFKADRAKLSCTIPECLRAQSDRGWCVAHYQRWKKYGDPLAGGPMRAVRGTGPSKWEKDQLRRVAKAKLSQVSGETAEYVAIIKGDPCSYCGAPMEHVDHIVPFSAGGPTDWENLAPACARCNRRKSSKSLVFFLLEQAEGGDEDVGRAPYQAA
jgi:5-methylcytosine-specific restriction endonuclease McrA